MRACPIVLLSLLVCCGAVYAQTTGVGDNRLTDAERQEGFELLFNGSNLDGWEGDANVWSVREGMIVGRSEQALPRDAYLLLKGEPRADFVLRLDFQIVAGRAGLAWRADAAQRRGYTATVGAAEAQPPLRQGMWNYVEIACLGDRILERLNGVTLADGPDARFRQGAIALQLAAGAPAEVCLKNVRLMPLAPDEAIPAATLGVPAGWTGLFTGKDLSNWVIMGNEAGFQVTPEGILRSEGAKGGNWLRSNKQYSDFVLHTEWKVSPGGNSGVFIRAADQGAPWDSGHEVQISNEQPPRDELHCTGTLYGTVAANPRPDENPNVWHTYDIHCVGPLITVIVDGKRTVNVNQEEVEAIRSKALAGYVGLQDSHTDAAGWIEYRNLWIKELVRGKE